MQAGRELSERMGAKSFRPKRVMWVEKYRKRVIVLADQPVFQGDTLFLSSQTKGKLAREDWRALLASSILYDNRLRLRRRLARSIILIAVALVFSGTFLVSLLIVPIVFPNAGQPGATIRIVGAPFVVLLLVALWLLVRFTAPYMRHLVFLADRIAVSEFGLGDTLVAALKKLDAMGLGRNPVQTTPMSYKPSVPNRIRKLSTGNATSYFITSGPVRATRPPH